MGKTYRRDSSYRPKGGKDFNKFKKSNKFKKWNDKPHHPIQPTTEPEPDINIEES
jgi:hypothetical protein